MKVYEKMKKMGKYDPVRDGPYIEGQPGILKKVDSLVESVYNSEKNLQWLKEGGSPTRCPPPSELSDKDYNLFDSGSETDSKEGNQLGEPNSALETQDLTKADAQNEEKKEPGLSPQKT